MRKRLSGAGPYVGLAVFAVVFGLPVYWILLSSVLNYNSFGGSAGSDRAYLNDFPTFAAVAWYHDKVPNKPASLADFVEQARQFTDGPYASALIQGDKLPKAQFDAIARKMHDFTGLPVDYIERANLRISASAFRKYAAPSAARTRPRPRSTGSGPARS